jgi:hypothetical protein
VKASPSTATESSPMAAETSVQCGSEKMRMPYRSREGVRFGHHGRIPTAFWQVR